MLIHGDSAPDFSITCDTDSDEPTYCCGARGCYPDRLCGECRIALGEGCCRLHCTEAGAVVIEGDVMCAKHGAEETDQEGCE